jgi:hypothetical protein
MLTLLSYRISDFVRFKQEFAMPIIIVSHTFLIYIFFLNLFEPFFRLNDVTSVSMTLSYRRIGNRNRVAGAVHNGGHDLSITRTKLKKQILP